MAFLQEYTMLDELGKGGFATVYKVRHNELGYIRAIRVLNETIVDSASATYQKFLRECKLLLRLGNGNHPNIVHIYQPRLLDNKALVEMDYVDGMDILHYLKQNQNFVPAEEVVRMAIQISSALAYCHEDIYRFCMDKELDNLQDDPNDGAKVLIDEKTRMRLINRYKVIHNDIHSGNIMRREDGNFVLLDFGLAINGDEVVRSSRHTNGAPEFKAPEKWDDESILTEQSDIYSFGIVMYQYLAGRVPFPYNTHISTHKAEYELGEAHQKATPPSIEAIRRELYEKKFERQRYERDYPQWLEDVILKCLRKNPAERFKNGKELYNHIIAQSQKNNNVYNDVEIERLTISNKDLASEVNDLRATNNSLNTQLNGAQNNLTKTQQELSSAQKEIDELKNLGAKGRPSKLAIILLLAFAIWGASMTYMYVTKSGDVSGNSEVIVNPGDTGEVKKLKVLLAKKDAEIDKLQKENKTLKQKPSPSDNSLEVTSLNSQLSQKEKEIASLNSQLSQKDAEIKRLTSQLNQKISELEQANKDKADLKRKLQQSSGTSNSSDVSTLQTKINQKDAEIARLNKKISALENEITTLKKYIN